MKSTASSSSLAASTTEQATTTSPTVPTTTTTTAPAPSTTTPPATTTSAPPRPTTATAGVGGLTVTLSTTPSGTTTSFEIDASETNAHGALGYHLDYGDGAADQNAIPQFCTAGPGSSQSQRWSLTHHYATSGTYQASVTVLANCTPDRATATVTVNIT